MYYFFSVSCLRETPSSGLTPSADLLGWLLSNPHNLGSAVLSSCHQTAPCPQRGPHAERVGRRLRELPPRCWKAGEEARNSHVVPDGVRQDDDTALTFLQVLGSPHSNRHGTARAATWMGTKKRETSVGAAQGGGPQSRCVGHSTAPAKGAEAPRQSSSRGGTFYTRAAQDAGSGRTIGPTAL